MLYRAVFAEMTVVCRYSGLFLKLEMLKSEGRVDDFGLVFGLVLTEPWQRLLLEPLSVVSDYFRAPGRTAGHAPVGQKGRSRREEVPTGPGSQQEDRACNGLW